MKKVLVTILFICMICSCFAACSETSDEKPEYKFVLYCGLADADSGEQEVTIEEAQNTIRNIITDKGFGYTEYTSYGGYFDNDTLIENDNISYELIFITRKEAEDVAKTIKDVLNLKSILIEETTGKYNFHQ